MDDRVHNAFAIRATVSKTETKERHDPFASFTVIYSKAPFDARYIVVEDHAGRIRAIDIYKSHVSGQQDRLQVTPAFVGPETFSSIEHALAFLRIAYEDEPELAHLTMNRRSLLANRQREDFDKAFTHFAKG